MTLCRPLRAPKAEKRQHENRRDSVGDNRYLTAARAAVVRDYFTPLVQTLFVAAVN